MAANQRDNALVWGLFLSLYMKWQTRHLNADEIAIGFLVTFVGAFMTRMAVIYFGIGSPRFSSAPSGANSTFESRLRQGSCSNVKFKKLH